MTRLLGKQHFELRQLAERGEVFVFVQVLEVVPASSEGFFQAFDGERIFWLADRSLPSGTFDGDYQ